MNFKQLSFFISILFLSTVVVYADAKNPPRDSILVVKITGFESDEGQYIFRLFNKAEGYPMEHDKAFKTLTGEIKNKAVEVKIKDLPQATYAVAVIHDEDKDNELDTGFLGIPTEGVGSSNDAKGSFGPPSFEDASFPVDNAKKTIAINMH